MRRLLSPSSGNQQGFTLIELLIYIFLSSIVLAVVASIFISLNTVQQSVVQSNSASLEVQVALNSIQQGVRNAQSINLTKDTQGELLVARVLDNADTAGERCEAWWFDRQTTSLYVSYADSQYTLPSPTASDGWTLVSNQVSAPSPGGLFTLSDGKTLSINIQSTNSSGAITNVQTISVQPSVVTGGSPCF